MKDLEGLFYIETGTFLGIYDTDAKTYHRKTEKILLSEEK